MEPKGSGLLRECKLKAFGTLLEPDQMANGELTQNIVMFTPVMALDVIDTRGIADIIRLSD